MERRSARAVAVTTGALALTGAALLDSGGAGAPPEPGIPGGHGAAPTRPVGRGWVALPPTPIAREWAVSLRTEREVFLWGGSSRSGGLLHSAGLSFRDGSDSWRRVPSWPWGPREQAAGVWTGTEVLVWRGAGAAYDPGRRRWRKLPPAPLTPRQPAAAVWTGEEMLLWGDSSRTSRARDGAAFDPVGRRWRRLAKAPIALNEASAAWTGQEMIVLGSRLDPNNASNGSRTRGMAYNPARDRWRTIARFGLSPQASSIAWDGKALLAWDYLLRAGSYDPTRDRWRPLARVPLRMLECYPQTARIGRRLLAWYCGGGAVYDGATRKWTPLRHPPRTISSRPLGGHASVLFPPASDRATAFWAYRPPAQ